MPTSPNTSDRLLAALTLFTRLPFWRLKELTREAYSHAVDFWPFAGWITGGAMALTFCLSLQVLPLSTAAILAIGVRLLLTGALHEDGLADCCDGFGGGTTRQRILEIMKDSHIGTFGVLGLLVHGLFLYNAMQELAMNCLKASMTTGNNPFLLIFSLILMADVWGKSCASILVSELPYARKEEDAKVGVIYTRLDITHLLRLALALIPIILLLFLGGWIPQPLTITAPILTQALLALYMRKKIGGYTGDCCGATFLLCEASIYLSLLVEIK